MKLLHPVMPHVTEEIWSHLPARETRLIVAPWLEPRPEHADARDALDAVQLAARIFRRSGVRVGLEGEAERIFEAVVRPRENGHGDLAGEIERLRKEVERGERMLANERFVQNAPAGRRRSREGQAGSSTGPSSMRSAVEFVESD